MRDLLIHRLFVKPIRKELSALVSVYFKRDNEAERYSDIISQMETNIMMKAVRIAQRREENRIIYITLSQSRVKLFSREGKRRRAQFDVGKNRPNYQISGKAWIKKLI